MKKVSLSLIYWFLIYYSQHHKSNYKPFKTFKKAYIGNLLLELSIFKVFYWD